MYCSEGIVAGCFNVAHILCGRQESTQVVREAMDNEWSNELRSSMFTRRVNEEISPTHIAVGPKKLGASLWIRHATGLRVELWVVDTVTAWTSGKRSSSRFQVKAFQRRSQRTGNLSEDILLNARGGGRGRFEDDSDENVKGIHHIVASNSAQLPEYEQGNSEKHGNLGRDVNASSGDVVQVTYSLH